MTCFSWNKIYFDVWFLHGNNHAVSYINSSIPSKTAFISAHRLAPYYHGVTPVCYSWMSSGLPGMRGRKNRLLYRMYDSFFQSCGIPPGLHQNIHHKEMYERIRRSISSSIKPHMIKIIVHNNTQSNCLCECGRRLRRKKMLTNTRTHSLPNQPLTHINTHARMHTPG